MKRINKKQIELMREMVKTKTQSEVSRHFDIAISTLQYHINDKTKERVKQRAREYSKVYLKGRPKRTEYIRKYMSERRKNDPKFKEKQNKYNRDRYRKENGNL